MLKSYFYRNGEFNLDWENDDLFANLSYAYVQPKDKETDKDLARRSRQSLTFTGTEFKTTHMASAISVSAKSKPKK